MRKTDNTSRLYYLLAANFFVLGVLIYADVLETNFPDFYYFSVQEDEYMEWATFWAFLLAGVAAAFAAVRYRAETMRLPWFYVCISLFCIVVAMEEISWGQRVFGYRPPVYFLEHNYQQELNIHNVFDTDYRKLALLLIILIYGVVLPLVSLAQAGRGLLSRLGIVSPAPGLAPAFAATAFVYYDYPWSHTGEWVEMMLASGMLFALLPGALPEIPSKWRLPGGVAAAWGITVVLGLLAAAGTRAQRDAQPETLAAAQAELEALRQDFESGRVRSRCSLHKRLYTFVVQYDQQPLQSGAFAALTAQGLPEERAEFLLDPWNSPYWLRDRCNRATGERTMFIYSFGPNRRRESTVNEIGGDDVGVRIDPRRVR